MFQGGETALQADCGGFDSHSFHKVLVIFVRKDAQRLTQNLHLGC